MSWYLDKTTSRMALAVLIAIVAIAVASLVMRWPENAGTYYAVIAFTLAFGAVVIAGMDRQDSSRIVIAFVVLVLILAGPGQIVIGAIRFNNGMASIGYTKEADYGAFMLLLGATLTILYGIVIGRYVNKNQKEFARKQANSLKAQAKE